MNPELEYAEEWLPVVGWEGFYEVSNLGRVRSLPRSVRYSSGVTHEHPGKLLRQTLGGPRRRRDGGRRSYLVVQLNKNGISKTRKVHSLVAEAFIGIRPGGLTVDHVDGDKLRNVVGNLEYITPKEQIIRSRALGIHGERDFKPGGPNPARKLTDSDVLEIRRLSIEGMSQSRLAIEFSVRQGLISRILNRKIWRHI